MDSWCRTFSIKSISSRLTYEGNKFAILDFTAPTTNEEVRLIPIAIKRGVNPELKKNGIIGKIPPTKNANALILIY